MRVTKITIKNSITWVTVKAEQPRLESTWEEYTVISLPGRWNVVSNRDGTALNFVEEE